MNYNRNIWRSNTNGLKSECPEPKCKCSISFFFPILQIINLRLFLSQDLLQRSLSHFEIEHIFTLSSLGLRKRGTFNVINVWSKSCLGFNPSKSWSCLGLDTLWVWWWLCLCLGENICKPESFHCVSITIQSADWISHRLSTQNDALPRLRKIRPE